MTLRPSTNIRHMAMAVANYYLQVLFLCKKSIPLQYTCNSSFARLKAVNEVIGSN